MNEFRGRNGYTERVRDEIYSHVFAFPGSEVGGVLVGRKFDDGTQVIKGSIQAQHTAGDLVSLTFTQETWEQIHAEIEARHNGDEIVGWYHSHPGHGIFLSNHDVFIHENFFRDPSCLALVVDPLNGEEGMFGWAESELECFWHQPTSRAPVEGVLAPTLSDAEGFSGMATTAATVDFERQPSYDFEAVELDPEPLHHSTDGGYYEATVEFGDPPPVRHATFDDFVPHAVSRRTTSYGTAAYVIPGLAAVAVGVVVALLFKAVGG